MKDAGSTYGSLVPQADITWPSMKCLLLRKTTEWGSSDGNLQVVSGTPPKQYKSLNDNSQGENFKLVIFRVFKYNLIDSNLLLLKHYNRMYKDPTLTILHLQTWKRTINKTAPSQNKQKQKQTHNNSVLKPQCIRKMLHLYEWVYSPNLNEGILQYGEDRGKNLLFLMQKNTWKRKQLLTKRTSSMIPIFKLWNGTVEQIKIQQSYFSVCGSHKLENSVQYL